MHSQAFTMPSPKGARLQPMANPHTKGAVGAENSHFDNRITMNSSGSNHQKSPGQDMNINTKKAVDQSLNLAEALNKRKIVQQNQKLLEARVRVLENE